jgi:hypothetical protein
MEVLLQAHASINLSLSIACKMCKQSSLFSSSIRDIKKKAILK